MAGEGPLLLVPGPPVPGQGPAVVKALITSPALEWLQARVADEVRPQLSLRSKFLVTVASLLLPSLHIAGIVHPLVISQEGFLLKGFLTSFTFEPQYHLTVRF